ncbi:MAG TPA: hypothetical protein VFO89_16415, partial [Thermoanaerobaculia bacterium]|nr:hypothetical protein [Thermoanaerobaculia bacterium]
MRSRLFSVSAMALVAALLLGPAAGADERCVDRDCTMIALFDGAEGAASTAAATNTAPAAAIRYGTWGVDLE